MVDSNSGWVLDSRETSHILKDCELFMHFRKIPPNTKCVYVENNAQLEVQGIGICEILIKDGHCLHLLDVLYVPQIRRNLISVSCFLDLGFELTFHGNKVNLFSNKKFVGSSFLHDGFFILNSSNENSNTHCLIPERQDEYLWHSRLGHVGESRMKRLAKEGLLGSLRNVSLPVSVGALDPIRLGMLYTDNCNHIYY